MATSGSFLTSDSGQGDSQFYGRTIFNWSRTSWGRTGSVGYHNISFTHKTYGGQSGYYQYFYQGSMNVDGQGYSYASPIKAFGAGATTLGSGSKTLNTNSSGDRSFSASAQGGIFNNTINTTGSGSWALDNIPMYGGIDSVTPSTGLTDETSSISVAWHKFTGIPHLWFRLDLINNSDATYHITNPSNPYSWSGFQSWLQTSMVNTNSTTLYIYYGDDLDSNGSVDNWNAALTYAITIKNDTGQANPTFTNFTYKDTNATTVAVTGNDQYLVQTLSTLQVKIATANKATANKNATMSSYTTTIGGYSQGDAWSSGSDVVRDVGTISDVTGSQSLSVKASDSRTNSTTVTKTVSVLPYGAPGFYSGLNVSYTNQYDSSSGISVDLFSGTTIGLAYPLTISGTDKNPVNTTTGVKFDMSKNDDSHYTGTLVNVTITNASDHSGYINTNGTTLGSAILTKMNAMGADNTTPWFIKFQITDAFSTSYYTVIIDIGRPVFRIGNDGFLYYNETEMSQAVNNQQNILQSGMNAYPITGTYGSITLSGFIWGTSCFLNTSAAQNDVINFKQFLPKGTYDVLTSFVATTDTAITRMTLSGGAWGAGVVQYDKDNYAASTTENTFTLTNMVVLEAAVFTFSYKANSKNASSSAYAQRVIAMRFRKTA